LSGTLTGQTRFAGDRGRGAPTGAEATPVTSALGRAPGGAVPPFDRLRANGELRRTVRGQDPLNGLRRETVND